MDKVTSQPEWALVEVGATGPDRTFVPLVSAGEEGDTVRVLFAKSLVEGAPAMAADRELSEEQERELYRPPGVPYSRPTRQAASPPANPGPPNRPWRLAYLSLPEEPMSVSTSDVAAGKPEVPAEAPTTAADEPLPTGGGALREAAAPEAAPITASAVGPALGRVDEPVAEASVTNDGLVATRQLRVTDPRVGAGAAAAVALAVGIWRRERIGRQVSTTVSRLGTIPATITLRRRRRAGQGPEPGGDRSRPADHGAGPGDGTTGRRHGPATGNRYREGWPAGEAGVRATQRVISQGARRVRPGRRRRRRGATSAWLSVGPPGMCWGPRPADSVTRLRVGQVVAATAGTKRLSEQAV